MKNNVLKKLIVASAYANAAMVELEKLDDIRAYEMYSEKSEEVLEEAIAMHHANHAKKSFTVEKAVKALVLSFVKASVLSQNINTVNQSNVNFIYKKLDKKVVA